MTDNEIIKAGDTCCYFYDNQNTSFSIVEVVSELSDECVVVKFHQVLRDDSGNDLFTYLCDNGKTMNVSRKYLHKLDLINRQKAEIERLKDQFSIQSNRIYDKNGAYAKLEAENIRLKREVEDFFERVRIALLNL